MRSSTCCCLNVDPREVFLAVCYDKVCRGNGTDEWHGKSPRRNEKITYLFSLVKS